VPGKAAVSHELACGRGVDSQADRLSASAAALEKKKEGNGEYGSALHPVLG